MARRVKKQEVEEAIDLAMRRHMSYYRPILNAKGLHAVAIDRDVHLRPWNMTLLKGVVHYAIDPEKDPRAEIPGAAILLAILDGEPPQFDIEDGIEQADGAIAIRGDKPWELKFRFVPLKVSEDRKQPLTFEEVAIWLAIDDAKESGDKDLALAIFKRAYGQKQRRERKEETVTKSIVMGNTKVEKTIFGDVPLAQRIPVERYTGEDVEVDLNSGPASLALKHDGLDNMEKAERAEAQLGSVQRFWLTSLTSCVVDNPEKRRVYGSDMLKRVGYKKPLRPESASTMEEAARAITELTHISMWLDTTAEARAYEGSGRTIERITDTRIVNGMVSVERYEDGTVDFYVDLTPTDGRNTVSSLPLYGYASDKRQLLQLDSSIYEFKGLKKVTAEQRRAVDYICRQVFSNGLSNNIRLDTLMERCDIPSTKDKRYNLCKALDKILTCLVEGGIFREWHWTYDGRKRHGIAITPNNDKRY